MNPKLREKNNLFIYLFGRLILCIFRKPGFKTKPRHRAKFFEKFISLSEFRAPGPPKKTGFETKPCRRNNSLGGFIY